MSFWKQACFRFFSDFSDSGYTVQCIFVGVCRYGADVAKKTHKLFFFFQGELAKKRKKRSFQKTFKDATVVENLIALQNMVASALI